jgi:lambda repressor-like predicted transcriptional regulator
MLIDESVRLVLVIIITEKRHVRDYGCNQTSFSRKGGLMSRTYKDMYKQPWVRKSRIISDRQLKLW